MRVSIASLACVVALALSHASAQLPNYVQAYPDYYPGQIYLPGNQNYLAFPDSRFFGSLFQAVTNAITSTKTTTTTITSTCTVSTNVACTGKRSISRFLEDYTEEEKPDDQTAALEAERLAREANPQFVHPSQLIVQSSAGASQYYHPSPSLFYNPYVQGPVYIAENGDVRFFRPTTTTTITTTTTSRSTPTCSSSSSFPQC